MFKIERDCNLMGLTGLLQVTSAAGDLNLNDKHHIRGLKAITIQLSTSTPIS